MLSFHTVPGAGLTGSALPDAPVVCEPEPTPGPIARGAAYALTLAARAQLAAARRLDPRHPGVPSTSRAGAVPG